MGATIAFLDESGFSLRPNVGRTWAPKGQTPIIHHRFNWKRLHAVGAISCKPGGTSPELHIQVQPHSTTSVSTIAFLESLHKNIVGDVVLLWDGLPVHRGSAVAKYICDQKWLTVERFPAYAPELNPVEYLWSSLKRKDLANASPDTISDLDKRVHNAYSRVEKNSELLQGFLFASNLYDRSRDST